ncbi:MAG: hypothetical protein P4L53_19020 [Candidatus Obscuribacterales bacterium]|nr:hypothetical protein [Candidatus Obscuribacterales bacterium]
MKKSYKRGQRGAQMTEFAAALALLFMCFFVPLMDLGILPIRWLLAQELIQSYARQLSLCETYSQALAKLQADPSLETKLIRIGGVKPLNMKCRLIASTVRAIPKMEFIAEKPGELTNDWLPNGRNAPISYVMQVSVDCEIQPMFLVRLPGIDDPDHPNKGKVPGLNGPVPLTVAASASWENLGRNPVSKNFYVNE